jgi:small GTP-binding protein
MEDLRNIKIVVIGSKCSGKTNMLNSFVMSPQSDVEPFESYNGIKVQIEDEGEMFQLELWDTNSADHQKMIRKIYYENCNVVLVCYSVMEHESMREARKKVREGNLNGSLIE